MREEKLLGIQCGDRSIRFRLPFVVQKSEIDLALSKVERCLPARVRA
ncbi:MAG: hypothetical protein HZA53_13760 [Planctomycetes bacterium]|nr:hypothetical protein [Planctomycetota bacterium]